LIEGVVLERHRFPHTRKSTTTLDISCQGSPHRERLSAIR